MCESTCRIIFNSHIFVSLLIEKRMLRETATWDCSEMVCAQISKVRTRLANKKYCVRLYLFSIILFNFICETPKYYHHKITSIFKWKSILVVACNPWPLRSHWNHHNSTNYPNRSFYEAHWLYLSIICNSMMHVDYILSIICNGMIQLLLCWQHQQSWKWQFIFFITNIYRWVRMFLKSISLIVSKFFM